MRCASKQNQNGFTLVEISIVMIIIGLLIGGTFGGMRLIENMHVNKAVQDYKSTETAALTFRDSYGRLPGDLANASARLPNCTSTPCSNSGNGDRMIGGLFNSANYATSVTDERFVFWHHLSSANLLTSVRNENDLAFGAGQPAASIGNAGFRVGGLFYYNWDSTPYWTRNHIVWLTGEDAANFAGSSSFSVPCRFLRSIDDKVDDGRPRSGRLIAYSCTTNESDAAADWSANMNNTGATAMFFRF